ncbi:MAG: hypothetical protein MK132_09200 [Lentisphaerales bacterium]|nr:hypothetical protein [Lentisphaerales bacterium]
MKFLILFSAILLSSCISTKYTPTNEFDFKQLPQSEHNISVGQITTEGPYSTKLVTRQGYSIIEDEFNRWCENPEDMFTRQWKIAFIGNASDSFHGVIRRFDFDLNTSEAVIIFDLVYKNKTSRITVKEKFTDTSTNAKINSMNSAFQKLTNEITKKF